MDCSFEFRPSDQAVQGQSGIVFTAAGLAGCCALCCVALWHCCLVLLLQVWYLRHQYLCCLFAIWHDDGDPLLVGCGVGVAAVLLWYLRMLLAAR